MASDRSIPYGTLCGAMTQNIEERAKINTSRSVSAMIAIGVINIVTVPLISAMGNGDDRRGYFFTAALYGCIFAACHIFCFAKTKEVVEMPEKKKISLKEQLSAVGKNRPYLIAVPFYIFSCLAQFFFSGFNTAIYAIVPDCVEYGKWKTGLRNDGFQYAFISLGNKIGMAIGTSLLAGVLGACGYMANQQQNPIVLAVIRA